MMRPKIEHTIADVARYYDEMTSTYVAGFGEVFQGSRPESTEALLDYTIDAAALSDGMTVLDAGCGVCGPSIWFAAHRAVTIEALTISSVQQGEAKARIAARGLEGRVTVRQGDFHRLAEIYPPATFDRILFLETFCHAEDFSRVLAQAKNVLKPNGAIYMKDWFFHDYRSDPEKIPALVEDVKDLNRAYCLSFLHLPEFVDLVCQAGFLIEYLREPRYAAFAGPWLRFEELSSRRPVPTDHAGIERRPPARLPQDRLAEVFYPMEIYLRRRP